MCYHPVPNAEFFLNCGDLPGNKPAIFSWVKKPTSADTMWAYWSFLYMNHLDSIRGNVDFSNKLPVAVWRGSPSGLHWNAGNFRMNDRVKLVKICSGNISLCDAKLVIEDDILKTLPFASAAEAFLGASLSASHNRLSMEAMCRKYKYIIVIDGNSAPSSRLLALTYCNSLLLIQQSPWREFWYRGLRPYVHYLPISPNMVDVLDQITWAQNNPLESLRIVKNMNEYAEKYLNHEATMCFMYQQIKQYAGKVPSKMSAKSRFQANVTIKYNEANRGEKLFKQIFLQLKHESYR
jgi:hypothetical protein